MTVKFAARGISTEFRTASELITIDGVVLNPVNNGDVFVVNMESALSDDTVTIASDYNAATGGCTVEGVVYASAADLWSNTDCNVAVDTINTWRINYDGTPHSLSTVLITELSSIDNRVYKLMDGGDYTDSDDRSELLWMFDRLVSTAEPEQSTVYRISDGVQGKRLVGDQGDVAVYFNNGFSNYYPNVDECNEEWTDHPGDELTIDAVFGQPVTIPDGYHVVDVKTSTAYLFDNINHTLTYGVSNYSSSKHNYLQIGRIGDLGYSINLTDSDVENAFGNQPCLQLFRTTVATDSSSLRGFYFTYRSTQTPSSYGTSASMSINQYYDSGFGVSSGFLWFDSMSWSTYPLSIESNYFPWQLRYYDASDTQEYYKFFLQRSLWSVNNNTLTWLGDTTDNQDLAFYYYGSGYTRMQVIVSRKNKLPEAICFSKSGSYQFQDYTVNSGSSSYLYEKFKGDTPTDYSTDYEIVKIYNANGVEVSKEGVSIVTDQTHLRVQNNSGSSLTFNNIIYRKVITDYVTVSLYLRGTGIDNSLLAKTFTAGDYWWSCLKDQYGVSSVQALGCSVFSGDPFDTGFGMIEYDPVHYSYTIVGLYTNRESSSSATTSLSNFSISYATSQNFTASAGKYAVVIKATDTFDTSCKSWRLRIRRKSYTEGEKLAFLNTTKLPKSYKSYNAWQSSSSSNDETLIQNGIIHYGYTGYSTYKYPVYDENGDPISYNENTCYKVVGLVLSSGSYYARSVFSFYYGTSYMYNSTRSYAYPLINDSGNLIFAPFDAGYYGTSYELSSTIVAIIYEEIDKTPIYPRSSANQGIDSTNLATGSSSAVYAEGANTVLIVDDGYTYEIVEMTNAAGAHLDIAGITLERNTSGNLRIVNNSGNTIKWNKIYYIKHPIE